MSKITTNAGGTSDVVMDDGKNTTAKNVVSVSGEIKYTGSVYSEVTLADGQKTTAMNIIDLAGGTDGGTVTSVNGKIGAAVLTGDDIQATLMGSDGETTDTQTITQHLQTLKNDDEGNGTAIQDIQQKIPDNATADNRLAVLSDLKNGLEGDYCSKYGISDETKSGLPYQGTGNQVIIPAQLQLDMYGTAGLTTITGNITVDLTVTKNCELWLESGTGTVYQATKTYWQEKEPAESSEPCEVWISSVGIQVKSNDTGNVFRKTNITRFVKCIFTDGNLTRLCFTGCRVQNKQQYVPATPENAGTYVLKATVATNGKVTISWVAE